jgi:hypothetical protein
MASHNEFHGYVSAPKGVKHRVYKSKVRLDFNAQIDLGEKGAKVKGFALRLFTLPKRKGLTAPHPEIGVSLRPEEWLDLIDSMKEEYEKMESIRKHFDTLSGTE